MRLYTYWRSTSSFRVRIALALKGLEVDYTFVHLLRDGGEQNAPAYRAVNPQGRLPSLTLDDGSVITQSPAILEYLEEVYPDPPLMPSDPVARSAVRSVAAIIACDIHPLHNVGPLNHIRERFGRSEAEVADWVGAWIGRGLAAVELKLGDRGFCFGERPGLADVYLIPQLYAARRFNVPIGHLTNISRVDALAAEHSAFRQAAPDGQPDAG